MENYNKLYLQKIEENERIKYVPYLLLADEEEMVRAYLNKGILYAICLNEKTIGVALFIEIDEHTIELKNIALEKAWRGKGLGKEIIAESTALFTQAGFKKMIVGTANSSIDNIAFYQKCGFRLCGLKRGFFEDYPTPIYENGIRALDMVMFEKGL